MPLIKQRRRFKFSILCDVFLLMWLTVMSSITIIAVEIPDETTISSERNITSQLLQQHSESNTFKLSKRFDMYNDFSKIPYDTIHRILRDEEDVYRNDDQRVQRRWKKSTPSQDENNFQQQNEPPSVSSSSSLLLLSPLSSSSASSSPSSSSAPSSTTSTVRRKRSTLNNINNNSNNVNIKNNNNNNNNNNNDDFNKFSNNIISNIIIISNNHSTNAINLSNRNLSKFDNYLLNGYNLSEIQLLNLSSNNLIDDNIKFSTIAKLINLNNLDLSRNNLKKFHLTNSNVTTLNLSSNKVSNFTILMPLTTTISVSKTTTTPPSSSSASDTSIATSIIKLKYLDLSDNSIDTTKYLNLSILSDLEILDMSCNHIEEFDKKFFARMKTLKRLNLSKNRLKDITKEPFYNLLNIDTLILSYNNISIIDTETFLYLPNLQYLDLSYNDIRQGSIRALQGIPDLVGLSIAYNPNLGDVSLQEFVASWSLKELDASGTGLCRIPAALAQSVRTLKLVDNWFSIIRCGDLDSYPLLQYLDLSFSHIDEIEDDAMGRLEILQTLFLDHNNLKRVPISLPTSLENLFLHNNQIMDIQPQIFQQLSNLKTLDLSGNKLIYLPGLPLPKLLTLNLQSSELRGLSQSVVKMSTKLRDLMLEDNPIKCSDLLGIAEWASPCRGNDRIAIIDHRTNIKSRFENMHNFLKDFQSNSNCKCNDDIYKISKSHKCENHNLENKSTNRSTVLETQPFTNISSIQPTDSIPLEIRNSSALIKKIEKVPAFHIAKNNTSLNATEDTAVPNKNENNINSQKGKELFNSEIVLEKTNKSAETDINKSSSVDAKTQILSSFPYNSSRRNVLKQIINKNNSSGSSSSSSRGIGSIKMNSSETGIGGTSIYTFKSKKNVKQEQQIQPKKQEPEQQQQHQHEQNEEKRKIVLSKIKSDNNYVQTSVLLSQTEEVVEQDSQNRTKGFSPEYILGEENKLSEEMKYKIKNNFEMLPKLQNFDGSSTLATFTDTTESSDSKPIISTSTSKTTISRSITSSKGFDKIKTKIHLSDIFHENEETQFGQYQNDQSPEKREEIKLDIKTTTPTTLPNISRKVSQMFETSKDLAFSTVSLPTNSNLMSMMSQSLPFYIDKKKDQQTDKHKVQIVNRKETSLLYNNGTHGLRQEEHENPSGHQQKTQKSSAITKIYNIPILSSSLSSSSSFASSSSSSGSTLFSTLTPPSLRTANKMMSSKVNKADKVVFFDQPSAMDENGIIKRNQSVSLLLDQNNHQEQEQKQHAEHEEQHPKNQNQYQQEQEQQKHQQKKQLKQSHQQQKKMQKRPKLRTAVIQGKRYNQDSQQKHFNHTIGGVSSNILLAGKLLTTTTTTTTTHKNTNSRVGTDKHLKLTGGKKLNVTVLTFPNGHTHKTINKDNYPQLNRFKEQFPIDDEVRDKFSNDNKDVNLKMTESAAQLSKIKTIGSSLEASTSSILLQEHHTQHTKLNTAKETNENYSNQRPEPIQGVNENILLSMPPSRGQFQSITDEESLQSEKFSYSNGHPSPQYPVQPHSSSSASFSSSLPSIDSHLKVNTELSTVSINHKSNIKSLLNPSPIDGPSISSRVTHISNTSSNGLPPEQWLDIRTATGHPSLFIVIGVTFGMLLTLGLIHIYRCRRPWQSRYGHHHHHHNHQHHNHRSNHNHHNHNHPSRPQNSMISNTSTTDCIGDDSNCCDDYYIEVDQEVNAPARSDFLPMELLSSPKQYTTDKQLDVW